MLLSIHISSIIQALKNKIGFNRMRSVMMRCFLLLSGDHVNIDYPKCVTMDYLLVHDVGI